jgi:predicted nucleic acid-binding protein
VSERRWVVNASPLIMLANIDRAFFLRALCADLIVPTAVADEIRAGSKRDTAQRWLETQGHSYIRPVDDIDPVVSGWDLGAGESQVLTWARLNLEYEAILDDRAARNCAITLGIQVRGTLGVVLLAKREGLIPDVRPVLDELLGVGLRIAPDVLNRALELADE